MTPGTHNASPGTVMIVAYDVIQKMLEGDQVSLELLKKLNELKLDGHGGGLTTPQQVFAAIYHAQPKLECSHCGKPFSANGLEIIKAVLDSLPIVIGVQASPIAGVVPQSHRNLDAVRMEVIDLAQQFSKEQGGHDADSTDDTSGR